MAYLFLQATVSFGLLLFGSSAYGKTAIEVYEQAAKSTDVVENIAIRGKLQSIGSGVVLSGGDVATNCHVIKGAAKLRVRSGSKNHVALLKYSDLVRDICSLSVLGLDAPAVSFGSTKNLKVGAKVYAIGTPRGLELSLSDGIISSLREIAGGKYIQTTAAISSGSSGGGLFDENGALIGLTTFYIAEGQNLNFALPVEWLKELSTNSFKAGMGQRPLTYWVNKSIELENRRDWQSLLEHSRDWTNVYSDSSVAWYTLGNAYANSGEPADAIHSYRNALSIYPEYADAWSNLGVAYVNNRQFDKAIDAYEQSLKINPESAMVWNNLGNAYGKTGQFIKSIDSYRQALRINPEYVIALRNLGANYLKVDDPRKSIDVYQHSLQINPEDADAWFGIGIGYQKLGQISKAVDAYQKALRINPDHARAWFNLGFAYDEAGQLAKAVLAYQQALRINPEDAVAWNMLGAIYSASDQPDKALEVYRQLKMLDPVRAEHFLKSYVIR